VSSEASLKQSIDKAKKRYSSLFRLPSDRKVFSALAFVSIVAGLLSTLSISPSASNVVTGLFLGLAAFAAGLVADSLTYLLILTKETIYNLRRTTAISLFSWCVWLLFILAGIVMVFLIGLQNWWLRFCLLGFSAVIILRLIVLSSTTEIGKIRVFAASLLEPFLCVSPFLTFWFLTGHAITAHLLLFLVFAVAVGVVSATAFLYPLDRIGKRLLGVHSLSFFRAFMFNWVLSLNTPFEQLLEELGEKKNVETSLVDFVSANSRTVVVVPSVHPGPFKNIGSSLLPSLLKSALEREHNCVACVPHGLLGHEFDLASQQQNQKIIDQVVVTVRDLKVSKIEASPFVKETNSLATACCQVFGNSAIISLTLAPRTIEDLPEEVGLFVRREAEKNSIDTCAVVNAHNSISKAVEVAGALESLKEVASGCLRKAVALRKLPFEVGSATVAPKEFSLEDGMGAGGITVIVVKTDVQKAGYVVVDGNNMVSGLREEILTILKGLGIEEGEVFTTDTHSVSALILGKQGYHPIGEAMDKGKLMEYIKQAALEATSKLEPVQAACKSIIVNDVTVLGEKQLETLCVLIDKSLRMAKHLIAPVFLITGLVLMLFLLFL
jgi:putative membrane protein